MKIKKEKSLNGIDFIKRISKLQRFYGKNLKMVMILWELRILKWQRFYGKNLKVVMILWEESVNQNVFGQFHSKG